MTLAQLLLALRGRWILVMSIFVICVLGAVVISLLLPPKYTATATVLVDFKGAEMVSAILLPSQLQPDYLATQIDIIKSRRVGVEVVRKLGWNRDPAAKEQFIAATGGVGSLEDWYADMLSGDLEVLPGKDSSVVQISYTARDAQHAATVANAFAEGYQRVNLALHVEPARAASVWFEEQLKTLNERLQTAQARLQQYQREQGYTASDERSDLEAGRLSELSQQYTNAQAALADAQSRQRQLADFLAQGRDPQTLPDILSNPLVQNLKAALAQSEARLQQISSQLGANHPEVRRVQADIAQQRSRLEEEVRNVASALRNSARIVQSREAELGQALAQQKARLLHQNAARDQLAVRIAEVQAAQQALDAAARRSTQTGLESQVEQTNVAILSPAIPPMSHSSPKLKLNVIVGAGMGLLFGTGLAFLREVFDRRIRSETDLLVRPDLPLLGTLDQLRRGPLTSRQRIASWLALPRRLPLVGSKPKPRVA
jgi:polysaccharide biosynthesis transport protein